MVKENKVKFKKFNKMVKEEMAALGIDIWNGVDIEFCKTQEDIDYAIRVDSEWADRTEPEMFDFMMLMDGNNNLIAYVVTVCVDERNAAKLFGVDRVVFLDTVKRKDISRLLKELGRPTEDGLFEYYC